MKFCAEFGVPGNSPLSILIRRQYIGRSDGIKMCLCDIIECVFTTILLVTFVAAVFLSMVLKTALFLLMMPLALVICCAAATCCSLC